MMLNKIMNKKIIAIMLTLLLLFLISCKQQDIAVEKPQKTENQQTKELFEEVLTGQTITDSEETAEETRRICRRS